MNGSKPFEIYTDNNPLTYVLTSAKLDACGQRWVAKLVNYNFTIRYKCGQSNVEADALSRISWPKEDLDVDLECMDTQIVNAVLTGSKSKSSLIESISCSSKVIPDKLDTDSSSFTNLDWVKLQRADPNLSVIIKLIESDQLFKRRLHRKDSQEVKALLRIKKNLKLTKDILYRKSFSDNSSSKKVLWQLVVPKAYRARALAGCHVPSQFLLPNLDNSSDNEDTKVTELITEAEIDNTIPEEEIPSVNSGATFLVNTNEFLEFMDTIDMGESQ